jgi:hypothetical protein
VLLVEKLKPSLLSVSQTCDQGHLCIFESQKCEIRREDIGNLVGTTPRNSENVYILDAKLNEECHVNLIDESWLWHRRLGHINFDNLVKANNLGLVTNLPKIIKPSNVMCRHCCWARDMITFMMVIIHFCRMYICVFHILKELFEEFYFKTV